ncbi:MAG: rnpA [Acidobacteria bacterium]|nr:rnpA [Acidobacteriota bacterium]
MWSEQRLRSRLDFKLVYAEGIKVVGAFVVVFARPREGTTSRLGITATRRCGCAVERNRSRRRIRELFRRHPEALEGPTVDLVVNIRRGCARAPWPELEAEYLACVSRVMRRLGRRGS